MSIKTEYVLVTWPESQDYMDEPWFDTEAFLANNDRVIQDVGCSAYFIPSDRIKTLKDEN